jgi:hypothetical protein
MDRARGTNRTEEEWVRYLMAKPERRKPVGRARGIWKDNIEIYILLF